MNSSFAKHLGLSIAANIVFFSLAFVTTLLFSVFTKEFTALTNWQQVPSYLYLTGLISAFIVLGSTVIVPLLGARLFFIFFVAGQVLMAIAITGDYIHTPKGKQPHETPRALETEEIPQIVEDYRQAAERAKNAGFNGVEIHAGNGYLIDAFLQSKTNHRSDRYGGSLENRYRFLKEIVESVLTVWSPERVGVRLSPNGLYNDMGSPDYRDMCELTEFEPTTPKPVRAIALFSEVEKTAIASSDTFFITTAYQDQSAGVAKGVDVSHRGGKPGFVRIDGDKTLTVPDFSGNCHFNTLGN